MTRLPEAIYRDLCFRCLRAASVCTCALIAPFSPRFEVVLLQHPKERKNSIGTARMTHLCITNSRLIAGVEFDGNREVETILDDPANAGHVLFPGPTAIEVDRLGEAPLASPALALDGRKLVVFVIDGTWAQAKGMLRKSARLGNLPRVSFQPSRTSNYRVRKQPNRFCLSTIEATHRLIQILDPRVDPGILLTVFDRMVEKQVSFASRGQLRELSRELARDAAAGAS